MPLHSSKHLECCSFFKTCILASFLKLTIILQLFTIHGQNFSLTILSVYETDSKKTNLKGNSFRVRGLSSYLVHVGWQDRSWRRIWVSVRPSTMEGGTMVSVRPSCVKFQPVHSLSPIQDVQTNVYKESCEGEIIASGSRLCSDLMRERETGK